MKLLKLLSTLLSLLFFVNASFSNQTVYAEEVTIDEYIGQYLLKDSTSIIYGITIDEDKFQIILNNDHPLSDDNSEEVYADQMLEWIGDLMRPGGALTGNLDPTNESTEISAKEDQQILALHFAEITEAPQFPSYKLVFSNPEYTLIEGKLIIKFQGNRIWELSKGEEDLQLVDGKNSVFTLIQEE